MKSGNDTWYTLQQMLGGPSARAMSPLYAHYRSEDTFLIVLLLLTVIGPVAKSRSSRRI